jgi:nitrogenase molybdenum-iron protein beta chain
MKEGIMATNKAFIERPRSFCALGGALITATSLPGVIPILHSSIGCGTSIYYNQCGSTGYLGAGYCGGTAVPSSNVDEQDVVFGGDKRLREQVENTLKLVDGELYVILTGCVTDIIGDDIHSVARDFKARGAHILDVETGGFKGNGYLGYDLLLQALFRDFVEINPVKERLKVNLWGIVPGQDAFWRGNLRYLRELLEQLGLKVNTFLENDASLDDLRNAGDAQLNIVVSKYYGLNAAETFKEVHSTDYLSTHLPIGPTATTEFIRSVGQALDLDSQLVENVIDAETKAYWGYVSRFADVYNDMDLQRYAVVVGDANYAPALTRFLADDIGWLTELTVVTDDLNEDEVDPINDYLANLSSGYKTHVVYETDAREVSRHLAKIWPQYRGERYYKSFSPAYVIGSHEEREFARSIKASHLTVSYPVANRIILNRGYTGFQGSLSLIEDVFEALVAER